MSILDTIDGALADYAASGDAMRWVPEEERANQPDASTDEGAAALEAFGRMMANVAEGINRAYAAMLPVIEEHAKACAEFARAMAQR